jgi:hypothetical protein
MVEMEEKAREGESTPPAQEGVNPTEASEAEVDPPAASANDNDTAKDGEAVGAEKLAGKGSEGQPPVAAEPSSGQGSPVSDVYVDAPTPADAIDDERVVDEKPEEKDGDDEDDKRTVVEARSSVGSAAEKPAVNGTLTEEPVHVNGVQESGDEAIEEEERTRKEKEEKARVVYVGDSTWEERTWKEIVRLREDMFWARIGGVRE